MVDEEWIRHDGKGVPADAVPGVTVVRQEPHPRVAHLGWTDGTPPGTSEDVWKGFKDGWDWSNWGRPHSKGYGVTARIVAYRNPRAASTETGFAMLREILDREAVDMPRKVRVKG